MSGALLKVIGITVTVLGAGATVVSDLVAKKQMDMTIKNEVAKAVADAIKEKGL